MFIIYALHIAYASVQHLQVLNTLTWSTFLNVQLLHLVPLHKEYLPQFHILKMKQLKGSNTFLII